MSLFGVTVGQSRSIAYRFQSQNNGSDTGWTHFATGTSPDPYIYYEWYHLPTATWSGGFSWSMK